jgi:UDP-glucuronate 4-epimerase
MSILVTGAAGFIGFHVAGALLRRGEEVVGLDCVDDAYDVTLKRARLALLADHPGFRLIEGDIADRTLMEGLPAIHDGLDRIVHLAAKAGVRASIDQPRAYVGVNVVGQIEVLELARRLPRLRHLVYASSSSVYGDRPDGRLAIDDPCDTPRSIYAATKRADELMGHAYSHLHGLPITGLRFFTVYGPWGRPDMAPMLFARAILEGRPIRLYNGGDMLRDFTYIDDIVAGVLAALDRPAVGKPPHRLYNLGHDSPVRMTTFLDKLEAACGCKAIVTAAPMQPGDVHSTHADIALSTRDLGFRPRIDIEEGIPLFVAWFRRYYGL